MTDYKISPRAEARLLKIEEDTAEKFGTYQADAYITGFQKTFELIAAFPGIGRAADELSPGYRRYRYQSHYIFYTQESDHILIRSIIHVAQNLRPDLFE
jgi:toxin ParE1/3/4